jgi:2-keto-4-pentenoate hydratase/2-oxohepta-3-ene-1,7-dioic acid hydratase in catechol pathway
MKLARFHGADEAVTWGVVKGDTVIDVPARARAAGHEPPTTLKELLARRDLAWVRSILAEAPATGDTHRLDEVRLLAPLPDAGKIVAVGRNYADHVDEADLKLPARPKIFTKFDSTVIGPGDDIVRPTHTSQLDYEVELAVVIGTRARDVTPESAMDHVAGYTVTNDISARDIQFSDEQLTLGKNFDTFCPMGPVVTTVDELPDPAAIELSLTLNGTVMQSSSTKHLIFDIPYLVAFLSSVMTLNPGDVLLTGTPSGVGCFRNPPVWLQPGDVVETSVVGVGTLVNHVVQGTVTEPARGPQ